MYHINNEFEKIGAFHEAAEMISEILGRQLKRFSLLFLGIIAEVANAFDEDSEDEGGTDKGPLPECVDVGKQE